MSQKEIAFKLEELMNKAEMTHSLQNTLFTAFYCKEEHSIRDFEWAFVLLGNLIFDIESEMKELTDNIFNNMT
ncbi:hypothetical protein IMSAGC011_03360 [Lachnospiraceae bacterium]|nr:hypothetical protein IMSAGC011_03360 [Lachnospiraceae bacterium]